MSQINNAGVEQSLSLPWFALRVRDRSEHVAASALREKGFHPLAPTYTTRRLYSDRVKTVASPIFPGYVFCRFDPQHKFVVLNSPAVKYIVSFGNAMSPVPEEDITAIHRTVSAGAIPVPYISAGQRVRVVRGSLNGLEGILLRSDGASRVVISVAMLQRSIAVHIDVSDLVPV